jgi:hypothetical protein
MAVLTVGEIPCVKIIRRRGDTKSIDITLVDENGVAISISGYTDFLLTVNTEEEPINTSNQLFQLVGTIVDAPEGKVSFTITTSDADNLGEFYYDAQYTDTNAEKFTFVEGEYIMPQDKTKT